MSIFSSLFGGHDQRPKGSFAISDKELLVRGWSDTELRQILGDFQQVHRDRLPQNFSTEVQARDGGVLRVIFPADIQPRYFCFLINYVQYPKNFDLKSRTILVSGRATMRSDFLPSEQSLIGKRILFYIPADDKDYDVVFAQVDGQNYKCPFSTERWQSVPEPRIPIGVGEL
jgi:hypothetical protein